jgi:hypothetical protein
MPDLKNREQFSFKESLSEMALEPKTEAELHKAIFGVEDAEKYAERMVDSYEEQLGIKVKETPLPKLKVRHIMLSPGTDDDDSALLDGLYNDPELYQVLEKTAYWTQRGEYKLFIQYTENMDVRKSRERDKAKGKVEENE